MENKDVTLWLWLKGTTQRFSRCVRPKNTINKENFRDRMGWACRTVQTRGKEVLYYTSRFWGTQQQKSDRLGYERRTIPTFIWFF